jgi:putative oxidoreductase
MLQATRLQWSLLSLRVGVFIVMLMWTLDKFIQPEHSGKVFENFYGLAGLGSTVFMIIGLVELLLILAFLGGVYKRFTYGLVLLIHGVSTFSSFQQYLDPFNNLLFFAAWPMLAACISLYLMRNEDTLFTFKRISNT